MTDTILTPEEYRKRYETRLVKYWKYESWLAEESCDAVLDMLAPSDLTDPERDADEEATYD